MMTEHDLLEVVEIEEASGLSLWGWESYRAELERPESIMLVARHQSHSGTVGRPVLGFIAARIGAGELHVNNVGVREALRRQGMGGSLLGTAIEIGARRGVHSAVLEVRAGNQAAQALYRRIGFSIAGQRRNYYRNPTEDALVMTLILSESDSA
ncbi:MAG: ribosomal protein S18-alanine N-acetyltransferase [Acidobacteria bacterium]|nr:ribosomal protein S18-alanine N-acetyltransferase [Acidobacteriota bacterium]